MKKYAKIINSETNECQVGLGCQNDFYCSLGMVEREVEEGNDGRWFLAGFVPQLPVSEQNEKIKCRRQAAYCQKVDPLTSQIERLRDEEPSVSVIAEIETLKRERTIQVAAIRTSLNYVSGEDADEQ